MEHSRKGAMLMPFERNPADTGIAPVLLENADFKQRKLH